MAQPADALLNRSTRLLNRNFVLLWQGQTVSLLGTQGTSIAMLFWLKHATDSATLMGLMLMVSGLVGIALGPIGGTIADRFSRRKVLIVSDAVCGLAVLGLAGVALSNPGDAVLVAAVLAVSVLLAGASAVFNPAIIAAVPDLVPKERLSSANSLIGLSLQLSTFIGQGIGGMLFRVLGPALLFLVDGLSYLASAVSESFIVIPQTIKESKARDLRGRLAELAGDVAEGFRYVAGRPGLRDLVAISSLLNFFSAPLIILFPFYVEDVLKLPVDWYGFLMAGYGAGSIVGYILAGAVKVSGQARGRLMIGMMLLQPFGYWLFGVLRDPFAVLGVMVLGGLVFGAFSISLMTLLQVTTPGEVRGRVFGILATIAAALAPLAQGLAGVIADLTGRNIPPILIGCGVAIAVVAIYAASSATCRSFLSTEVADAPEEAPGEPAGASGSARSRESTERPEEAKPRLAGSGGDQQPGSPWVVGSAREADQVRPAGSGALIDLRDVAKTYGHGAGEVVVLHGVTLQVQAGESVGIVGPSGSGKSTLLNVITGIDRPTRGEVRVCGQSLRRLSENRLARWRGRTIGVVFQFFQLLPTLTIVENVVLPMDLCGVYPASERKPRAMQLLEQVGIVEQARKLPGELSGGQQQRAAIARALANEPAILIADEPTGNLDSKTAARVLDLFGDLTQRGVTLVIVTHDRGLAAQFTRTISLADGQIAAEVWNGPPAPDSAL